MVIKPRISLLKFIFVLIFLSGFFIFDKGHAQLLCSNYTNADGTITYTDDSNGALTACNLTPDSMTIILHFIGLCTSEPTIANFRTACSSLFSSSTGESKKITTTSSANLMNDVTITEGNYTHAAILIKNNIGFSVKKKFSPARSGKTGTGEWCWTLDGETTTVGLSFAQRSTWIAECGADEPTTIGTHTANQNAVFSRASGNRFDNYETGTTASTTWSVYLLKADETINTGTPGNYDSFGTASYYLGIQKFNTAVSITPKTSNLDVGFRLEDTFSMETTKNGGTHYIPRYGLGGFEFKVLASE